MQLACIITDSVFKKVADYESQEDQSAMNQLFIKGVKKPLTAKEYLTKQFEAFKQTLEDAHIKAKLGIEDISHRLKKFGIKVLKYINLHGFLVN